MATKKRKAAKRKTVKRATPKQAKLLKKSIGRTWKSMKVRKSKSGKIQIQVPVR